MSIKPTDHPHVFVVSSHSIKGLTYEVNIHQQSCSCQAFKRMPWKKCKHILEVNGEHPTPPPEPKTKLVTGTEGFKPAYTHAGLSYGTVKDQIKNYTKNHKTPKGSTQFKPPCSTFKEELVLALNTPPILADLRYDLQTPEGAWMYRQLEKLQRVRLSKHFLMRDFLYSTENDVMGILNYPEDVEHVIQCGKALCERVLEPMWDKFGQLFVTYGYQNRAGMETATPSLKKGKSHSSCPHHWDRGTFKGEIYARCDFFIAAVEDGLVDRCEAAEWMMMNLDVDLCMQFWKNNQYCLTIGPKPRRVWLEWVPYGYGDGKSNRKTYMGEYFWQSIYPTMPEDQKPKFGPSATDGKMWWG